MEPFDVAQGFVELCEGDQPPASRLTAGLQRSIEALGFRYFACCSHVDPGHPPPQAVMVHNYPAEWVRHYSEAKLYEIDPVLRHAERDPVPFYWDQALHVESMTAAQRRMMLDAAQVDIAHGFTIPIHLSWLPGALRASCSILPDASSVPRVNYLMVEAMATAMYAALNRANQPRYLPQIELSRRERQCLSLAAQGKDEWTIGQLLELSPMTVHSYFKRLMGRLGVRTRMQAVVWALEAGQISFGEVPALRFLPPPPG